MPSHRATTSIYIAKSYPKGEKKECAIYVRVTYNRKHKYYSTGYSLSVNNFEKIMGEKPGKLLKKIKLDLQAKEIKASKVIADLNFFSFTAFEKYYLTNKVSGNTILQLFADYVKILNDNEQIGTASSYECARNSLESFQNGLKLTDVTSDLLTTYEKWMLKNDKTKTTIGIYLRSLRSIFNKAISDGIIPKDLYPFGSRKHGKYEIPKGSNTKKALSISDIALIYNYKSENDTYQKMKDYWLFLYLANGMNVKDMCLLKYKNIKHGFIEFERAKTERTKSESKDIRVVMTAQIKAIITRRGNPEKHAENYIFPILSKNLTAARQRQIIQQITALINEHMRMIAEELKIKTKATTYTARHSFATILQRSGVAISFISEALGHSNVTTTEKYLAGFEDEKKIEAAKALTDFNPAKKRMKNLIK